MPSAAARTGGFTLVEGMVVLAIAAVLAAVTVPGMRSLLLNSRLTAAVNDLLASVSRARSEALKQQLPTAVCFSSNPTAATPTCDYAAARGWIVFVDTNGDWTYESGEPILERHPLLDGSVNVRADGDAILAFSATGFATPSGLHQALRNAVFCDSRGVVAQGTGSTARALLIVTTGRARATATASEITTALGGGSCP